MEDLVGELKEVDIEPDFSFKMGDHGVAVPLLDLGGKVGFGHPGATKTETVGRLHLGEEIAEHFGLTGEDPPRGCVGQRKEDVEAHLFQMLFKRPPSTAKDWPLT